MAKKINYHTIRYGQKDAEIKYGHIHDDEVTSGFMIRMGPDGGRHYSTWELDSIRKGWTIHRCPGVFEIKCGDDIPYNTPSLYIEAVEGDIVINAKNGRIRMEAENIDMIASGADNKNGVISLNSNEKIELRSKNIEVNATSVAKFFSSGLVEMVGDSILNIYGGLIDLADGATQVRKSKAVSSLEKQESGFPSGLPFL